MSGVKKNVEGNANKPVVADDAETLAADAKSHIEALVGMLVIPVPILLALVVAAFSLLGGASASIEFQGAKLPLAVGLFLIMGFNGLVLLTVTRIVAVLWFDLRKSSEPAPVEKIIRGNLSILNPFFALKPDGDWFERIPQYLLYALPKISVGILLGFHFLFFFTAPDVQKVWGDSLLLVATVAGILHVVGNLSATLSILGLDWQLNRFALLWIVLGYMAGGYVAVQVGFALAPATG